MPKSSSYSEVRQALLARSEIALIDVREEDPFAQEHRLWAARLSLSRIALEGGLEGWRRAGGELFRDVNVPGKSFGDAMQAYLEWEFGLVDQLARHGAHHFTVI